MALCNDCDGLKSSASEVKHTLNQQHWYPSAFVAAGDEASLILIILVNHSLMQTSLVRDYTSCVLALPPKGPVCFVKHLQAKLSFWLCGQDVAVRLSAYSAY